MANESKSRTLLFIERDAVLAPARESYRLERDGRVLCVVQNAGKAEVMASAIESTIVGDLAFESGFITYTIFGQGTDGSVLSSTVLKSRGNATPDVQTGNGATVNAELVRLAKQSSDQLLENNRQLFAMMMELHKRDQDAIARHEQAYMELAAAHRQAELALATGRTGDDDAKAIFWGKLGDVATEAAGMLPLLLMQKKETTNE